MYDILTQERASAERTEWQVVAIPSVDLTVDVVCALVLHLLRMSSETNIGIVPTTDAAFIDTADYVFGLTHHYDPENHRYSTTGCHWVNKEEGDILVAHGTGWLYWMAHGTDIVLVGAQEEDLPYTADTIRQTVQHVSRVVLPELDLRDRAIASDANTLEVHIANYVRLISNAICDTLLKLDREATEGLAAPVTGPKTQIVVPRAPEIDQLTFLMIPPAGRA